MSLDNYCLNAVFCGQHAVIGESLCRDCLTREAEERERQRGRADARIQRILKRLTSKPSRASHERKAGLR